MGEIVTIHVGQCGNRVGVKFWEALCKEHSIDTTGSYYGNNSQQLERINVFFNAATGGLFRPRAVLVDLEPGTLDSVQSGPYGTLFRPNNFVFGQTGSANNWAKGYYTVGAELIDDALDVIRVEAEGCTDLQGFILIHSLGGGTGSGMGSLLVEKLREEYQDKVIATFSVFPSAKISDTVIEPYSATLSIKKLTENADVVFCIDNEALYNIASYPKTTIAPTYADLNAIIANAMSSITAPLRFPSQGTSDFTTLRAMVDKLVPREKLNGYSRLHFLTVGLSPARSTGINQPPTTVQYLFERIIESKNRLVSSTQAGRSIATVALFRGQMTMQEIQESVSRKQMPDNLDILQCSIPPQGLNMAAILIKNDSSVQEMLQRISTQFTVIFRRQAFLHWYKGEGMDEMEFVEAESDLSDLITGYKDLEYLVDSMTGDMDSE